MTTKINLTVALDIGGSLTKVGMFCLNPKIQKQTALLQKFTQQLLVTSIQQATNQTIIFYLTVFDQFQQFIDYFKTKINKKKFNVHIICTGGGAFKYKGKFQELQKNDKDLKYCMSLNEFQVILAGIQLLTNHSFNCTLINQKKPQKVIISDDSKGKIIQPQNVLKLPLILSNIGSGMSILKLYQKQGKITFERIGGSALGGCYLIGLQRLVNPQFQFNMLQSLKETHSLQNQIVQSYIQNTSQLINLYSAIHKIQNILITGGVTNSQTVRKKFLQKLLIRQKVQNSEQKYNQTPKNIFFTRLNGYLGVIGLLFQSFSKSG